MFYVIYNEHQPNLNTSDLSKISLNFFNLESTAEHCQTPDKRNGVCISIRNCESLFQMASTTLFPEQLNFLRASKCGTEANYVIFQCLTQ